MGQQFLGHIIHSCTVLICRPYHPTQAEKGNPELYKENLRKLMLERLGELHEREDKKKKASEDRTPSSLWNAATTGLSDGVDRFMGFASRGFRDASARIEGKQR